MKAQRLQECRGSDTAAALHGVQGPLFITARAALPHFREGLLSSCTGLSEPLTGFQMVSCSEIVDRFIEGLKFKPARERKEILKIK